jgi:glycosyltransferase involved in cell wall biosynthesis
MDYNKISLIILNYNRANYLDRSLRSCADQIIFNKQSEILLLDDGSTDNSIQIAKSQKIPNLRIIKNKKNKGIGFSSNRALKNINGEFFIRVDSDDFLSKHACELMSGILIENKNLAYVCCDHYRVDARGLVLEKVKLNTISKIKNHGAGIMFRKSAVKKVGGYNKNLLICEDYDLIARLNKKYNGFYMPMPLYRYYQHDKNISKKKGRKLIISKLIKHEI